MTVKDIENIVGFRKLSELSSGDTFLYGSDAYIVTNFVNCTPSLKTNNIAIVDLNNGRIHYFSNDEQVIPIKLEAIVHNVQSKDLQVPIYSIKSWI